MVRQPSLNGSGSSAGWWAGIGLGAGVLVTLGSGGKVLGRAQVSTVPCGSRLEDEWVVVILVFTVHRVFPMMPAQVPPLPSGIRHACPAPPTTHTGVSRLNRSLALPARASHGWSRFVSLRHAGIIIGVLASTQPLARVHSLLSTARLTDTVFARCALLSQDTPTPRCPSRLLLAGRPSPHQRDHLDRGPS